MLMMAIDLVEKNPKLQMLSHPGRNCHKLTNPSVKGTILTCEILDILANYWADSQH